MKFSPRPYQQIGIEWILDNPRAALWAGMGMGKTVTTLSALDILIRVLGEGPALVLAPKRVARDVWPAEARKWDHLQGLKVVPILGTPEERIAALNTPAHVHVINYDNIPWLRKHLKKRWPWRIVVSDESTRLKNYRTRQGGVRTRALQSPALDGTDRWINLTGTPAPNGLRDLWGQTWFLDYGDRLGSSYAAFEARWFAWVRPPWQSGGDRSQMAQKPLPFAEDQIKGRLHDICLTLDPHDWFDFKDPIVNRIEVTLPPAARRIYRDMERELAAALPEGKELKAASVAAQMTKCLQLASGAVYHEESASPADAVQMHTEKLDALESILEEAAGNPLLVAYHWQHDLLHIRRRFPQAETLDAPDAEARWNAGEIPLLLVHPASAGHGLNLQDGGHTVVFYSLWWDKELHDQVIERVGPVRQIQSGYDRPVYVHYLVASKTLDEAVLNKHALKTSTERALLDYMNRVKR